MSAVFLLVLLAAADGGQRWDGGVFSALAGASPELIADTFGTMEPRPALPRVDVAVEVSAAVDAGFEELFRNLEANLGQIRYCVVRHKSEATLATGDVATSVVVGADGAIRSVELVSSTVSDPDVAACIVKRMKTWKLPRGSYAKPTKVTWKLTAPK